MLDKDTITSIADKAPLIVNGYAYTPREDGFISILNLNHPDCAMVINKDCDVIETNMDPIEQQIVRSLSRKNLQFLEAKDA